MRVAPVTVSLDRCFPPSQPYGGGVALRAAVLVVGECGQGLAGVQGKFHSDIAVDVGELQNGVAGGAGDGAEVSADVLDVAADRRAGLLDPVGAVAVGAVVVGFGSGLGPGAAAVVSVVQAARRPAASWVQVCRLVPEVCWRTRSLA
jgi:hypothetical protein